MPSSNMVGFFWIIHFHIHGERKREEKKESQLDWSITGKPGKRMNSHKPWGPSVELRLQEMVGQTSLVTSCKALGSGHDLEECPFVETSRRGTTNSGKKVSMKEQHILVIYRSSDHFLRGSCILLSEMSTRKHSSVASIHKTFPQASDLWKHLRLSHRLANLSCFTAVLNKALDSSRNLYAVMRSLVVDWIWHIPHWRMYWGLCPQSMLPFGVIKKKSLLSPTPSYYSSLFPDYIDVNDSLPPHAPTPVMSCPSTQGLMNIN